MKNKIAFEEILKQNKKRIHYHIHKLKTQGSHYGLMAMWSDNQKYQPDKGLLATYFNFIIRNQLKNRLRKETL